MMNKIRLGDAATFINGYPFKPLDWKENGIPIIRIQNLTGSASGINYYDGKLDEKYIINNGDVLISWSASLGIYEWANGTAYLNQHIFKVKFDKYDFNKKYFIYLVRSKINEMIKQAHGSTMKHITKSNFEKIEILVRDKKEQDRIANLLDKIDYIIQLRKNQISTLDELVKARFVELFDRAKNSKISKLNDVCDEITAGGDRPKDTSEVKTEEYPYPVFANAATNEGLLCFSREYKIEKPCVTIAARGCTVGFTAIRSEKFTPVVRLISLVPNEEITPIYLKYYIDIKMCIEGNGAAQPQLTIPMIKGMEIMVPPIELQNQFASFVKQTDKSKLELQKSLEEMQNLFDSLMAEYFG